MDVKFAAFDDDPFTAQFRVLRKDAHASGLSGRQRYRLRQQHVSPLHRTTPRFVLPRPSRGTRRERHVCVAKCQGQWILD